MMKNYLIQKKSLLAVQAALLAVCMVPVAGAETDPAVTELTDPVKEVEVGAVGVSQKSNKFGEYNGLNFSGTRANMNLNLAGQGGEESTTRWSVKGTDLGLDTRRLEAEGGQQGFFNLYFLYDELQHKISDTYQTIFNGAGSTSLTLPSSYPSAASRLSSTATANDTLANWNNIQAPNATNAVTGGGPGYLIPSLMHNEDIGFKRRKTEGGLSYIFMPGWELKVASRVEDKKGTKLTGYAFNSASTATMLPEPISFKTTGLDFSLAYTGEKANVNLAYLYSQFDNDITAWTAQTPFAGASVINSQALFSSAPANKMEQLKLGGGYRFTSTTRLSYEGSKSMSTQNSNFNCQVGTGTIGCVSGVNGWLIPVASPDARVQNDTMYAKLTSRPFNSLNLSAAYKYDSRDNQTPVNSFRVSFADNPATATNVIANDPINTIKRLVVLDADYSFIRAQAVKVGYQQENINRTSDGSGLAPSRTFSTTNTNNFTLPVHDTREDTWSMEYRNSLLDDLAGRVSYAKSTRTALDYATPTLTDTTNVNTLTNAYYRQFRDFYVADRTRDKVRAAVNYQMSDAWALGLGADYNRDQYADAAVKESTSTIYNLDISYAASADFSVDAYYSLENRKSSLAGKYIVSSTVNGTTVNGGAAQTCSAGTPCILANWDWTIDQSDIVTTFGLGMKKKGLMSGKLEMNGDLVYIKSKTPVTAGGGGVLISDGNTVPNYVSYAAASYPDITSETIQFSVRGNYKMDKVQTVRVVYMYQYLTSSDWQYDAYTNPIAMQAYIGTGMTSPQYSIHALGISYGYQFK